jgi:TRAP-type C4-dicarboxylate transport system permease small subunit
MDRWERADEIIDRVEETFLVILLSSMIVIAFLQIVLRNLFSTGLSWGDPLVRNLVLWIGFIGAALATREGKHININVVSQWVPNLGKVYIEFLTQLFSFVICGLLTLAALKFIKNEAQMGNVAFLDIPAWIPEIILPIIFGLMTLQFGFRSFKSISTVLKIGKRYRQGGTI